MPYCGEVKQPCKNLPFTINNITRNNDVIHVDGGKTSALIYRLNQSINVTKHFQVKKFYQSRFHPIISARFPNITAFQFVDDIMYNCSFVSIDFERLIVVSFHSPGNINITGCIIRNSQLVFQPNSLDQAGISIFASRVYLINHTIMPRRCTSKMNLFLKLSNSYFEGDIFHCSCPNCTFQFINSTFQRSMWKLTRGSKVNMSITGCKFNTSVIRLQANGSAVIRSSDFENSTFIARYLTDVYVSNCKLHKHKSVVQFRFIKFIKFDQCNVTRMKNNGVFLFSIERLEIRRCSFKDNIVRSGAMLIRKTKFAKITDSRFVENVGWKGGAIRISQSNVHIENSIFLSNNAQEFGGALYSEGGGELSLENIIINGSVTKSYPRVFGRLLFVPQTCDCKTCHL